MYVCVCAPLPPPVSNNCVNIISYNDTLFMGWRSAPFHFASNLTKMFIVSSIDGGFTWEWENTIQVSRRGVRSRGLCC